LPAHAASQRRRAIMQYILEIVVEKKDRTWDCVDTIESESAIPIPAVGDEVMTPNGWIARVINRQFWFTYVNRVPLAKIEIRCRRVVEEVPNPGPERPRRK
jgi:hypothetical protein